MAARILSLCAFVALAQAKAFVTNMCDYPVYVWSVPDIGTAQVNGWRIDPTARYEERFRWGADKSGVAIKVSTQPDGIYHGKDEIDFAYSIDPHHPTAVWVDLSPVRGHAFNTTAFHWCEGPTTDHREVAPTKCDANHNIELVLCGWARTSTPKDKIDFQYFSQCYDWHHQTHSVVTHSKTTAPHTDKPAQISTAKPTEHNTVTKKVNGTTVTVTYTASASPVTVTDHEPGQPTTVTHYGPIEYHTVTYHEPVGYGDRPYSKPPLYTSAPSHDYTRPDMSTRHEVHHDDYHVSRPTGYGDDRAARRSGMAQNSPFTIPEVNDEWCSPKVTWTLPYPHHTSKQLKDRHPDEPCTCS